MPGARAHFEQEGNEADQVIGVTGYSKFAAVQVLVSIGHGVNRQGALFFKSFGDRLVEQLTQFEDKLVGLLDAERHWQHGLLAGVLGLDPLHGVD